METINYKPKFYNYYSPNKFHDSILDKFIYYQMAKAHELGITEFTAEMNIAFTKILNKCLDYEERGIDYDFEADILKVLTASGAERKLLFTTKKVRIPKI